ncbi:uncharacterized protein LOC129748791 [Uranotaenia lowii]|uniref:uncharacterized protein LOC129748791 n=1 Tax=Uranotaenia lowii TaxID=190385 RepID=UPI002478FBA9|nr:uncharacterized protein LOC129748791 [Uranotaenia lowii]
MARLTLSILASLIIYFAYHALASEALATVGSKTSINGEVDNPLGDEGLSKLQTAWLRSVYNRRPAASPYAMLRKGGSSRNPTGYLADVNLFDGDDIEKRFDDYGHMRFGKRGGEGDQFDDYGHMRFGRRR